MDANSCIKCSVDKCQYHAQSKDNCTLEEIQVGTHEKDPTKIECTDCQSFELR